MSQLEIKDLHVRIEDKEILKGLSLNINEGEIHAIMGPNGTGKSTLAYTLMGHPNYIVTQGEVIFKGQNVLELEPDERSRLGIFLAFQYPVAIPGVTVANFLRTAINSRRRAENPEDKGMPIPEFRKLLKEKMSMLKMDQAFAGRYLNDGFSGGEKKRAEILQMATLKPEIAILDETDSGLDIDALRVVAEGVNALSGPAPCSSAPRRSSARTEGSASAFIRSPIDSCMYFAQRGSASKPKAEWRFTRPTISWGTVNASTTAPRSAA